jgi:hypothetical protein
MRLFLTLAPFALIACDPGADVEASCLGYYTAYEACVDEYLASGADESEVDRLGEGYCDPVADDNDQESADSYDCLAAAYTAADCSSTEGVVAAEPSVNAC